MVQVTWEEAASSLGRILEEVGRGEEFVITRDDAPLARLSPVPAPRQPGSGVGIITYIAEDFDAPLDDFKEYEAIKGRGEPCPYADGAS